MTNSNKNNQIVWTASDLFADFNLLVDYLGIVIPLGISAAATSLMCLVSAKEAGDPFPVRESLIADGIGTCIASFFGSPFGTVIYVSTYYMIITVTIYKSSYYNNPSPFLSFLSYRLVILHTNVLVPKLDIH
jgi:hypothetical protein